MSRSDVLLGGGMVIEWPKKFWLAANRTSPDARDQARSCNTTGGLIRPGVAEIFSSYLNFAAKIGRRKFGFGAPKKKIARGYSAPVKLPAQ